MNTFMANEVLLATIQHITEVSGHTYSCWLTCLLNVSLQLRCGVILLQDLSFSCTIELQNTELLPNFAKLGVAVV